MCDLGVIFGLVDSRVPLGTIFWNPWAILYHLGIQLRLKGAWLHQKEIEVQKDTKMAFMNL